MEDPDSAGIESAHLSDGTDMTGCEAWLWVQGNEVFGDADSVEVEGAGLYGLVKALELIVFDLGGATVHALCLAESTAVPAVYGHGVVFRK